MKEYFASKEVRFKSFASLRVSGDGKAIGVINVECSETHVFGIDQRDKDEIAEYLFPVCWMLGILFLER